ncbi:hypothetical protein [Cohnella caldifontis]|uniref:hypothetical protein n=1 Tax=Cohnella caldifontis TaxID=3027471 RepID=UPI0023ECFE4E|nr:hypothetical protein [Cohnella sp. YIM B05605]
MENAALLSPADVHVIRRYVHTKYAPLPEAKRADIVADAIRRTVQRRMPELPAEFKDRITDELIRKCLVLQRREIKPEDVLDVCAEIELPDPASEAMILDPVLRWMNEKAPGAWNPEGVAARLFPRRNAPDAYGTAASSVNANLEALPGGSAERLPIRVRIPKLAWLLASAMLAGGILAGVWLGQPAREEAALPAPSADARIESPIPDVGMPLFLRYRDIDAEAVKAYLDTRDSLLAEEPYFGAIVENARVFDVHPLLLFAITGQEQGFVPKSNKNAKKIANNPFNVFHSWEEFNTDIRHSAEIAARTVSNRGSARPEGEEPFAWLNGTYAEDPNWADGVRKIFEKLSSLSRSSPAPAASEP